MQRHYNNFTVLRLVAALLVVVSHSYFLTGNQAHEPMFVLTNKRFLLSDIGLYIFFFTSGYLVTNSLTKSKSILHFLYKRCLRIYPALIIVVLITVFLIAPIVTRLSLYNYFHNKQTWAYLLTISGLKIKFFLPSVFDSTQFYDKGVNGSLWSIGLEIKLYLSLCIFEILNTKKTKRFYSITSATIVIACFIGIITNMIYLNNSYSDKIIRLIAIFFVGSLLQTTIVKTTILKMVLGISAILFLLRTIIKLPLDFGIEAIIIVSLGTIFFALQKRFVLPLKTDISYGIYIYAFIVQQVLFQYSGFTITPLVNIILTLVITIPIAWLSWQFIEKPALDLKTKFL